MLVPILHMFSGITNICWTCIWWIQAPTVDAKHNIQLSQSKTYCTKGNCFKKKGYWVKKTECRVISCVDTMAVTCFCRRLTFWASLNKGYSFKQIWLWERVGGGFGSLIGYIINNLHSKVKYTKSTKNRTLIERIITFINSFFTLKIKEVHLFRKMCRLGQFRRLTETAMWKSGMLRQIATILSGEYLYIIGPPANKSHNYQIIKLYYT